MRTNSPPMPTPPPPGPPQPPPRPGSPKPGWQNWAGRPERRSLAHKVWNAVCLGAAAVISGLVLAGGALAYGAVLSLGL